MLLTHHHAKPDKTVNRPIARHGRRKPDIDLTIAMVEMRLTELPANSMRRKVIEQMIEQVQD